MTDTQEVVGKNELMKAEELFKVAVSTRQFEIQMLWQRSNYFMVLNTAVAVAYFSLKGERQGIEPVVVLLGVLICVVWFNVNLGSKYWQSRWEEAAARFERICAPEAKLFAADQSETFEEVKVSLARNSHNRFQRWIDGEVLKKPSVSFWMMVLSISFISFWMALFIFSIGQMVQPGTIPLNLCAVH